jgi:hypothetical protein
LVFGVYKCIRALHGNHKPRISAHRQPLNSGPRFLLNLLDQVNNERLTGRRSGDLKYPVNHASITARAPILAHSSLLFPCGLAANPTPENQKNIGKSSHM